MARIYEEFLEEQEMRKIATLHERIKENDAEIARLTGEVERLQAERDELRKQRTTLLQAMKDQHAIACGVNDELSARLKAAEELLSNLFRWSAWVKENIHKTPRMNEPNSGALSAAFDYLAKYEQGKV